MSLAFLTKTVKRLRPSCCPLDNIPGRLFKDATNALGLCVVNLINSPLMSDRVPAAFKTCCSTDPDHIINYNPSVLSNFSPVSKLPFESKVFEQVEYEQLQSYFNLNGLLKKFQSGFKLRHNREMFLLRVFDDLFSSGSSRICQAELCPYI